MKRLSILSSLLLLLVLSVTAASAGGLAPLKPISPAGSVQTNMVRLALGDGTTRAAERQMAA